MKSIRRSLKDRQSPPGSAGSGYSSSNHHVIGGAAQAGLAGAAPGTTLPPVRAGGYGKTPPKKVIRAVTSVQGRSVQELSFEAGDFFHVVGERVDSATGEIDWYDAANPLSGARGLVPAKCFQVMGRNEKENSSSGIATRTGSVMSHGSGHTLSPPLQQGNQFGSSNSSSNGPSRTSGSTTGNGISPSPSPSSGTFPHRSLPGQAKPSRPRTQPLYGIVQYDFRAERADELDAKRGENLIVIAQSNHEWFVAKPIGRLGGPGLIPVSFVAISDTTTGEPLPAEKVRDMIESGMVPPVEEWKKQTAEYKQASIPLGRFDFSSQSTPTQAQPGSMPYPSRQGQPNNTSATSLGSNGGSAAGRTFSPESSTSSFKQQNPYVNEDRTPQPPQMPYSAGAGQFASTSSYSFNGQQPQRSFNPIASTSSFGARNERQDSAGSSRHADTSGGQGDDYPSQDHERDESGEQDDYYEKYGLVSSASVESFHSEEENFWFHLRVNFSQSGYSLILYRLYDDFYEFQCALMDEHPVEAGRELPPDAQPGEALKRTIPRMPGPVDHVDEVVCAQRVDDLTVYLKGLCGLPDYMRADPLFYEFFVPRAGDVEAAVPDAAMRARWEAEKQRDRERDRELAHSASGTRSKKLDEEVEEYLDRMGSVTNGMGKASLNSSQQSQIPPPAKQSSLPPLDTKGPFTPGYSMSSASNMASAHARQQSQPYLPPSRSESPAGGFKPGGSGGPLSASAGSSYVSPFSAHPTSASSNAVNHHTSPPPFVKIKIFHRNTDDLIAIRVPPNINLLDLLDKVRERLGGDVNHVRYRDEGNERLTPGQMQSVLNQSGGARLVELRNDAELADWISAAQRLVAYVD